MSAPSDVGEAPKPSRVRRFVLIGLAIAVFLGGLVVLIIYLTSPSLLQPDRPFVVVQDVGSGSMVATVDVKAGLATYEPTPKGRLLNEDGTTTGGKSYTVHELFAGKTYNVTLGEEDAPVCFEASVEAISSDSAEAPVDGTNARPLDRPLLSGPSKDVVEKELKGDKKVILLKYYRPIRKFFIRERALDNNTFSEEIELSCLVVGDSAGKNEASGNSPPASDPPKRQLNGIPIHGYYCGAGHGDSTYRSLPRDRIDAACMQHDRCADTYMWQGACGRRGNSAYLPCRCQSALVSSVNQVLANRPSFLEWAAGNAIRAVFSWLPCGCRVNYLYCYYYIQRTCYRYGWWYYCRYTVYVSCYRVSREECLNYPTCYSIGYST